ncbi:D-inositol-3-phosphate glycosyltransferase [compost metagenome]
MGTEVGGIAEQIEHGVGGLLVPSEDSNALASALESVILDPSYRDALARTGWEKAKREYSIARAVHELKKVYLQYQP